jgi:hypothetical protein
MAYNASFPRGMHALQSNFICNAYFAEGQKTNQSQIILIINEPRSEFTEQSWLDYLKFF